VPTDLSTILEQQLRGIQMPDAISWWPLAIGWWIVITLSLMIFGFLFFKLYQIKQKNRYRKVAAKELKQLLSDWQGNQDTHYFLQNANTILKRIARRFHSSSVNQSGIEWANTLNQLAKQPLQQKVIQALCEDCYHAEPTSDILHLHSQLEQWIKTHQGENHA